jgi:hypothetical protein
MQELKRLRDEKQSQLHKCDEINEAIDGGEVRKGKEAIARLGAMASWQRQRGAGAGRGAKGFSIEVRLVIYAMLASLTPLSAICCQHRHHRHSRGETAQPDPGLTSYAHGGAL